LLLNRAIQSRRFASVYSMTMNPDATERPARQNEVVSSVPASKATQLLCITSAHGARHDGYPDHSRVDQSGVHPLLAGSEAQSLFLD
jgi:hypothetical protein